MDSKKAKTTSYSMGSTTFVVQEDEEVTEITAVTKVPQLGPGKVLHLNPGPAQSKNKSLMVLEKDHQAS